MILRNGFLSLSEDYLFAQTAKMAEEYKKNHPDLSLYRMGIGDVTQPLPHTVISAMQKASEEMGDRQTFKGYGNEQGYAFLRQAIKDYYGGLGIYVDMDEIFVGDGAKSDLFRLSAVFARDNIVLLQNPVYPAYSDVNLIFGRRIKYVYANEENHFLPHPPDDKADIIYLCSPNNPTGAQYDKAGLEEWVDYAKSLHAVIIFDNAYADYGDKDIKSIYSVDGADEVAVEVNSFSKSAGFTGVRCGYTIIPRKMEGVYSAYKRLLQASFNGVSYVTQCGAAAVFTQNGRYEIDKNIKKYIDNADIIKRKLSAYGIYYIGNAPYIFMKVPDGYTSWSFFEKLLSGGVLVTPGVGFGDGGEGFIRLSSFSHEEDIVKGVEIIVGHY